MTPPRNFAVTVHDQLADQVSIGLMGESSRIMIDSRQPVELGAIARVTLISPAGKELLTVTGLVGICQGGPPFRIGVLLHSRDRAARIALASIVQRYSRQAS